MSGTVVGMAGVCQLSPSARGRIPATVVGGSSTALFQLTLFQFTLFQLTLFQLTLFQLTLFQLTLLQSTGVLPDHNSWLACKSVLADWRLRPLTVARPSR